MDTVRSSASRSRASTHAGNSVLATRSGARFRVRFASWKAAPGHPFGDVETQRLRKLHRTDTHLLSIGGDLLDAELPAGHAQRCDREQRRHLGGKRPVPIDRLLADALQRVVIRCEGDPPVQLEAEGFLRHPPRRNERPDRQVDPELLLLRRSADPAVRRPTVGGSDSRRRSLRPRCGRAAPRRAGCRRRGSRGPEARSGSPIRAPGDGDRRQALVRLLGELPDGGKKKYANARSPLLPTRPRSWYSCARPSLSARSTIRVFAFGTSSPTR